MLQSRGPGYQQLSSSISLCESAVSNLEVGCRCRRCLAELYQPGPDQEEQTHAHRVAELQFGAAEEVKEGRLAEVSSQLQEVGARDLQVRTAGFLSGQSRVPRHREKRADCYRRYSDKEIGMSLEIHTTQTSLQMQTSLQTQLCEERPPQPQMAVVGP